MRKGIRCVTVCAPCSAAFPRCPPAWMWWFAFYFLVLAKAESRQEQEEVT